MYKVLIVEDDMAVRFVYKSMKTWTECGFTIAGEEPDGRRALDRLAKEQFDLIFTDIRMPFMDGVELLRKLREKGDTTTTVFASSYSEFEYAQQGITFGVFDYIIKPIEEKKLADVLTRAKKRIDDLNNQKKIDPAVIEVLDQLGISPNDDLFVQQIAMYCSIHLGDDISGDDFAEAQGYNKDYFGKLFKQHFGIPYREFCSRVKISYAIELLQTGNYRAYEISDMLGYSSVDYFSKLFKKITGKTLAEFKSETGGKK